MLEATKTIAYVDRLDPQTDVVVLFLNKVNGKKGKTKVGLETGVKGCQLEKDEQVVMFRESILIKILSQACINGCKAGAECRIKK